jgi:hypothetical protein
VKNLKKGVDYINLPPFDANGPGERDSWSTPLPRPVPDMVKILQRITALQKEGGLKPSDLLLAFLDACVSPLQRRSHKMCFLGSARDPTRHSSRALMGDDSGGGAEGEQNCRCQTSSLVGVGPEALRPGSPGRRGMLVRLRPYFPFPVAFDNLTIVCPAWAEFVCSADCGELGHASGRLRRR